MDDRAVVFEDRAMIMQLYPTFRRSFARLIVKQSRVFNGRRIRMSLVAMCCVLSCALSSTRGVLAQEEEETPTELKPYRVAVQVAIEADPSLTPRFRAAVLLQLRERCDSYWGRMCDVEIRQTPQLMPATAEMLARMSEEDLASKDTHDKTFVITLESFGGGYRVSGRVWEAVTREFSLPVTVNYYRRAESAEKLFELLSDLFEPIVEIGEFDSQTVFLKVRAGEIPPADPDQSPMKPGRLLRPFYRFLSRENEVLRIQSVPWTYLVVDESNRALATSRPVSGLRVPLTTRRRRLVQVLAVGIRPRLEATQLRLESRHVAGQPLIGFTVQMLADDQDEDPSRLISDRQGAVTIPRSEDGEPVTLAIRSGRALLAKLPFVAGLVPESELSLPDDSVRLGVEGELSVLEAEITDAVAGRAVIMSRARLHARENQWEQTDALIQQIDAQRGADYYRTELTIIRERGVSSAAARGDRAAERRIERLCTQTEELIDRYLTLDKVQQLKEELAELRADLKEDANNGGRSRARRERGARSVQRKRNSP